MTKAMKAFIKDTWDDKVTDKLVNRLLSMLKKGFNPRTAWMILHSEYPRETTRLAVFMVEHAAETGEIKRYAPRLN